VEAVDVDAEEGDDVSGIAMSRKWFLPLQKGLAKRHRVAILDDGADEDTTQDIQTMISDIVKVSSS